MRNCIMIVLVASLACVSGVHADVFGTGDNQFTIDFVPIAGDASSANGTNTSQYPSYDFAYKTFTDPESDYRMGILEITNSQWTKFTNSLGVPVTGNPSNAYDRDLNYTDPDKPLQMVSWYEAAQFVNWLNTSTGHQAAYKFTGTQGTGSYTLDSWSLTEAEGGTKPNLYRHKDAMYYIPTDDEWVKAAYWNGTSLQTYATSDDSVPTLGVDSNYYQSHPYGDTWDVGSGSEELNGTFDMMGNVWEWMESPGQYSNYGPGDGRGLRGGSFTYSYRALESSHRHIINPTTEGGTFGFRVASDIPEPASLTLLALGGLAVLRRR